MTAVAIIPARFASTRFPGKPVAAETGKYLIQHVYERAAAARRVDRVIVATDDTRIADAVASFGGEAVMTRADHATGSERIAEVAAGLCSDSQTSTDLIVNVQGDEPEIDPRHLDALVELLETDPGAQVGTLACPFAVIPGSDPRDPNAVKVVVSAGGRAIYFSRSLIPYPRGHEASGGTLPPHAQGAPAGGRTHQPAPYLLHVGVYAYRPAFLARLGTLAPTPLERTEQLEQLRWLEHGFAIAVRIVDGANKGIDTPEDYAAFVERCRQAGAGRG
jgi:3-deoxy-manno-octulosonate cytidylyltransferase (CMP-KDO synthetase)